jgi:hypothetical protein
MSLYKNHYSGFSGCWDNKFLQLIILLLLPASFNTTEAAESPLLLQIQSSALAGDLRPVDEMIANLDETNLDELSVVLLQQYQNRFVTHSESVELLTDNALATRTILAFQDYWRSALTHALSTEQAELKLRQVVGDILHAHQPAKVSTGDVYGLLELALLEQGFFSSIGLTPPLRDLYIWSKQEVHVYSVELTDGTEQVEVVFIDKPLVQGWQHYASLDLSGTSGWATPTGLHCMCWSYDLDSEAFNVSWLKHETRHLVDFRKFPGMAEVQMEYRAKLTELAFYGNTVSAVLRNFANNGSAGSLSAHAQANYRVSHDIYREVFQQEMPNHIDPWQLLGPDRVAPAARRLLQADTELLVSPSVGASHARER